MLTGFRAERHRSPISEQPGAASGDHRVLPHCGHSKEAVMEHGTGRFGAVDWASAEHRACIVEKESEYSDLGVGMKNIIQKFSGSPRGFHVTKPKTASKTVRT